MANIPRPNSRNGWQSGLELKKAELLFDPRNRSIFCKTSEPHRARDVMRAMEQTLPLPQPPPLPKAPALSNGDSSSSLSDSLDETSLSSEGTGDYTRFLLDDYAKALALKQTNANSITTLPKGIREDRLRLIQAFAMDFDLPSKKRLRYKDPKGRVHEIHRPGMDLAGAIRKSMLAAMAYQAQQQSRDLVCDPMQTRMVAINTFLLTILLGGDDSKISDQRLWKWRELRERAWLALPAMQGYFTFAQNDPFATGDLLIPCPIVSGMYLDRITFERSLDPFHWHETLCSLNDDNLKTINILTSAASGLANATGVPDYRLGVHTFEPRYAAFHQVLRREGKRPWSRDFLNALQKSQLLRNVDNAFRN